MSVIELEQFYEVHVQKIYRFFFYKVLNREIAEDLTSVCFLKFTKELSKKEIENPRAFLYGIAKFTMIDHLRMKYKNNETVLDIDDEMLEVEIDEPENHILDYLEMVLPHLPEKQREVLRFRFIDKMSLQEIAMKLQKDVNYVSTTQKRGLQSIKRYLVCTDPTTNILE